jgi:ABC-type nickel/cobalt efflux system permease component RcnA
MVVKSTGVVLATVLILGAGIWIIDFAISGAITAIDSAANETETTEVLTDESEENHDGHDHDHEEETTEETTAE